MHRLFSSIVSILTYEPIPCPTHAVLRRQADWRAWRHDICRCERAKKKSRTFLLKVPLYSCFKYLRIYLVNSARPFPLYQSVRRPDRRRRPARHGYTTVCSCLFVASFCSRSQSHFSYNTNARALSLSFSPHLLSLQPLAPHMHLPATLQPVGRENERFPHSFHMIFLKILEPHTLTLPLPLPLHRAWGCRRPCTRRRPPSRCRRSSLHPHSSLHLRRSLAVHPTAALPCPMDARRLRKDHMVARPWVHRPWEDRQWEDRPSSRDRRSEGRRRRMDLREACHRRRSSSTLALRRGSSSLEEGREGRRPRSTLATAGPKVDNGRSVVVAVLWGW